MLGLNGAGKSTLTLTLNGVIPHILTGHLAGGGTAAGAPAMTSPTTRYGRWPPSSR